MTIAYGNHAPTPTRPGGKHKGIVVCWFLGLGSLVSWNSMLTIGDYYYCLFPKYHPSRVLTLVYQPFALGTMAILAYNEAKINTRKRNVAGYILFAASTLMLMVVDLATSGGGGVGPFIGICAIVAAFGVADAHVLETWLSCSFFAGMAASGALTSALRLITKAAFDKYKDGPRKGVRPKKFLPHMEVDRGPIQHENTNVGSKLCWHTLQYKKKCVNVLHGMASFHQRCIQSCFSNSSGHGFEETFVGFQRKVPLWILIVGAKQAFAWYPLVLIAMYNVLDLISRDIPLVPCLKLESRNGLLPVAVLSRFLLIPAFYFTAKYGDLKDG
ncbi:equilibrative nucleotide transporter 3 [Populus alba x Populus x berolinensis]|nr:equilibrative nucleotide transporter 3 [Populus alba x Populus x berolinensis]